MKLYLHIALAAFLLAGCKPTGFFAKKTAREKYADKIEKQFPLEGKSWKNAGELALNNPLPIEVPYVETGYFHGDSSDAISFIFTVKAGQKINLQLEKAPGTFFTTFIELWENSSSNERQFLQIADTLVNSIEHASTEDGNYQVRLQPKIKQAGAYKFYIKVSPILGWPIQAGVKSNIGSVWGDGRDGGARKHEGIDIFAKKGSYLVAVEDGTVQRIGDGGIGGKVIWFSPADYRFSVYYAHLDTQLVAAGQRVKKGDILGTVGNTGNAKFTPAHLHFGIYGYGGARDPIAYVQPVITPKEKTAQLKMSQQHEISNRFKLYPGPVKKNAFTLPAASSFRAQSYSDKFYRVLLEDGREAFVAEEDITNKMKL